MAIITYAWIPKVKQIQEILNTLKVTDPALIALVALVGALTPADDPPAPLRQGEPHALVGLGGSSRQGWQGPGGARPAASLALALLVDPRGGPDLLELLLDCGEVAEALPARDGGALPLETAGPHGRSLVSLRPWSLHHCPPPPVQAITDTLQSVCHC